MTGFREQASEKFTGIGKAFEIDVDTRSTFFFDKVVFKLNILNFKWLFTYKCV